MSAADAEIPLDGLADGYYKVLATAKSKSAESYFRKLPYHANSARVDRFKRQIQFNEKPFFPIIYSWCGIPEPLPTEWQIQELRRMSFNTIQIMPEMWRRDETTRMKAIDAFTNAGFKIMLWCVEPETLGKGKGVDPFIASRKQSIDKMGNHPALIGWYLFDEIAPDHWEKQFGIKEPDFKKAYDAIKAHDPYKLHYINWNHTGLSEDRKFYGGDGTTDLYAVDIYAFSHGVNFGALEAFAKASDIVRKRGEVDFLPSIVWFQTYSYAEGLREPHQIEYRNNVFVSLINDYVGMMHFIGRPDANELWEGMGNSYKTASEWFAMTTGQDSRRLARGKEDTVLYALWKAADGSYHLIAANTCYMEKKVKLDFSGVMKEDFNGSVVVIGGKGDVSVDGKTLDVELPIAGSVAVRIEKSFWQKMLFL